MPLTRTRSQCVGVNDTPGIWTRADILAFWLLERSKQIFNEEKLAKYWVESNAAISLKGVTLNDPLEAISTDTLPAIEGGDVVERLTDEFTPAVVNQLFTLKLVSSNVSIIGREAQFG